MGFWKMKKNQHISYYRMSLGGVAGSESIYLLDSQAWEGLDFRWKSIFRYNHPFLDRDSRLVLPNVNGTFVTGPIEYSECFFDSDGQDRIVFSTRNNMYEIRYFGINLERLLENGINTPVSFYHFEKDDGLLLTRFSDLLFAMRNVED